MSEPARTCGTCSLCCKAMWIRDLQKPPGVWCEHARPGRPGGACSIHETRFSVCRGFHCQWILSPTVPEDLKPDRSKVILVAVEGERGQHLMAYCDPSEPLAWRKGKIYEFLKLQTRSPRGRPRAVMVVSGRHYWLLTDAAEHDLGEADGTKTFRIEPGPDGRPVATLMDAPPPVAQHRLPPNP